ncbi:hypothetical protein MATL_G00204070 [Megalops atlanticus]|uniref:Uncharacterized protein n=1 Tax=Megalops atlanticus TaxID=7932 RepID=A0A9D3T087_MEGAT|nr:hypothetical protein MATL_G00204070 [Megalops atlanticus]
MAEGRATQDSSGDFEELNAMKFYTILTGNTFSSHKTFVECLRAKGCLTEGRNMEECDVILAFCPVSSESGSEIDAALQKIPASKRSILVVMHHTAEPNYTVPEKHVTSSDVFAVDCLFHETKGLLKCKCNDEAVDIILKKLDVQLSIQPNSYLPDLSSWIPTWSANPELKVYLVLAGNTLNVHKTFVERLGAKVDLAEVQNVEECDVILVFCPISSRAGIDIDASLQKIPADKPAILVVMHHTFDPNQTVPESSRHVRQ